MEKKGQKVNKQPDSGRELLDFDLDDLEDMSSLEIEQAFSEMDDDIIELTDLVEPEAEDELTRDMEVTNWLKESGSVDADKDVDLGEEATDALDQPKAASGSAVEDDDLDLSSISLELNLKAMKGAEREKAAEEGPIDESELDFLTEELQPGEETLDLSGKKRPGAKGMEPDESSSGDIDFSMEEAPPGEETRELPRRMRSEAEEEPAAYEIDDAEVDLMLEKEGGGEEEGETQEFGVADDSAGDIAEEATDLEMELDESLAEELGEEPAMAGLSGDLIGLSEERLEAAITKVVGEVVERVARETMAEVAEKVIGEAIEALRKSLEADSE